MNTDTVSTSISKTKSLTAEDFYSELISMRNQIDKLIDKVLSVMPPKYGSDAWWEKSDKQGLDDIKNGRYTEVKTKKELEEFLKTL